jgi:hypothetical protein
MRDLDLICDPYLSISTLENWRWRWIYNQMPRIFENWSRRRCNGERHLEWFAIYSKTGRPLSLIKKTFILHALHEAQVRKVMRSPQLRNAFPIRVRRFPALSLKGGAFLTVSATWKGMSTTPVCQCRAAKFPALFPRPSFSSCCHYGWPRALVNVQRPSILLFIYWAARSPCTTESPTADNCSWLQHIHSYGRSNTQTLRRCTGHDITIHSWTIS